MTFGNPLIDIDIDGDVVGSSRFEMVSSFISIGIRVAFFDPSA